MISAPANKQLIEWPSSTLWFDEDGIVYSIAKKSANRSLEETKKSVEEFRKLLGDKKVCMLADISNASPTSRELREYSAKVLPEFIKAMAMVSRSPAGKMLANLFFALKPQSFPTKVFTSEEEARKWLTQYL
jgi:hypothetical protein